MDFARRRRVDMKRALRALPVALLAATLSALATGWQARQASRAQEQARLEAFADTLASNLAVAWSERAPAFPRAFDLLAPAEIEYAALYDLEGDLLASHMRSNAALPPPALPSGDEIASLAPYASARPVFRGERAAGTLYVRAAMQPLTFSETWPGLLFCFPAVAAAVLCGWAAARIHSRQRRRTSRTASPASTRSTGTNSLPEAPPSQAIFAGPTRPERPAFDSLAAQRLLAAASALPPATPAVDVLMQPDAGAAPLRRPASAVEPSASGSNTPSSAPPAAPLVAESTAPAALATSDSATENPAAPLARAPFRPTVPFEATTATVERSASPVAAPKKLPAIRVLVVDDSETNRTLMQAVLCKAGALVATATDGQRALDKALAHPVDLVLLDMQMPTVDGYGVAAKLRDLGFAGPIIALASHPDRDDEARCRQAGCSGYLTKPIDPKKLLAAVWLAIDSKPLKRGEKTPVAPEPSGLPDRVYSSLSCQSAEVRLAVDQFADSVPTRMKDLRQAQVDGNYRRLADLAHGLKTTAGATGFDLLAWAAVPLALAAKDHDSRTAASAMARLAEIAARVETRDDL